MIFPFASRGFRLLSATPPPAHHPPIVLKPPFRGRRESSKEAHLSTPGRPGLPDPRPPRCEYGTPGRGITPCPHPPTKPATPGGRGVGVPEAGGIPVAAPGGGGLAVGGIMPIVVGGAAPAGWLAVCAVGAAGAGASGSWAKEKREPKGKCWTTGNLERTSALYIFIMPCLRR